MRQPELRTRFEFDPVDVPFEAERRIADGHYPALEMGVLPFQQFGRTSQAGGKDGLVEDIVMIRLALRSFSFFQLADLFHPFRMLTLQLDVGFCQDLDGSGRDGLSKRVGCPAHVNALVFVSDVRNDQGDVAEIVRLLDPGRVFQRQIVAEPLDFHRRISDRNQTALEMGVGVFQEPVQVLQRSREDGPLERDRF